MKTIMIAFWLILGLILSSPLAQAGEVTAVGTAQINAGNVGGARNQALIYAQRQAVEQGVGALIDSNTISENFEIIRDEILSSSKGFITSYEIVREGKTADGFSYQVEIRADVSDKNIADKLTALRILHKKMGNKRLMIVYNPKDPKALPRTNGAVQNTAGSIRNEFNRAGFRIFNDAVMDQVYGVIEQSALVDRPVEHLVALALDHRAEILVEFQMIAGKRGQSGGAFYATKNTVRLGVYDVSTGRQIADSTARDKELTTYNPGPYDWYEMLGKAGARAGSTAANDAIEKITDYYENVGDLGFSYLMVFRNFSELQEDMILDHLENMEGHKSLTELKNTGGYLEIELFTSQRKSRLRRSLRRELYEKEIYFNTQESSGNRMVFLKASPPDQ